MKLTKTERELLDEVREINSRHRVLGKPCKDREDGIVVWRKRP